MTEVKETNYPNIGQSWLIVGICILSSILVSPVVILLKPVVGSELSFLLAYLVAMGIPLCFAHWKRKNKTGVAGYPFASGSARIIVFLAIATVALQVGVITPISDMMPMPEFLKNVFRDLAGQSGVFSFVTIVIAAPVFEELLFRGIILDGLLRKYSPTKSIIVSSIFFGIVHLNPWQFVAAFVIGILSGWIYYKTRNLSLSILIHAVNNLVAFVSMSFMDAETILDKSLPELYGGLLNMMLAVLGAIAIGALSIHYIRLEVNKPAIDLSAPD